MMVFVDSNIPMYLVGAEHPHKRTTQIFVEKLVADGHRLITDVEVFQEILHRYVAISRKEAIQPAFDILSDLVDEVLPIQHDDVLFAKDLLLSYQKLSARDALHIALMKHCKIGTILSFDKGFDEIKGIERLPK